MEFQSVIRSIACDTCTYSNFTMHTTSKKVIFSIAVVDIVRANCFMLHFMTSITEKKSYCGQLMHLKSKQQKS